MIWFRFVYAGYSTKPTPAQSCAHSIPCAAWEREPGEMVQLQKFDANSMAALGAGLRRSAQFAGASAGAQAW